MFDGDNVYDGPRSILSQNMPKPKPERIDCYTSLPFAPPTQAHSYAYADVPDIPFADSDFDGLSNAFPLSPARFHSSHLCPHLAPHQD